MVDSAFYGGVHSTPLSLIYADEKRLLGLKITSSNATILLLNVYLSIRLMTMLMTRHFWQNPGHKRLI